MTAAAPEQVTLTIDGQTVTVPKGTNLIEAAKTVGIEIPHYCYHPNLSIAGNCRMCQVQVKGQPKLTIGCNTNVAPGMEVQTHQTSSEVAKAQAATLEFILINHPLDCTVCDQAGHCKLQDYHFEYNAKDSRFLEEKQHKVKAVPLGDTVMLDGERCIMCTRCIRFCDEVTGTSELGMLNRGDKSVIAISPGRPLDNPLSGSVVDLCPVGALTHRAWRFNTRIWFTNQKDSICPGCSTGCNVRVAERDGQVVQVKARVNQAVNKEWMCDEGRYGFNRFLPESRALGCFQVDENRQPLSRASAMAALAQKIAGSLVILSPDLTFEEYTLLRRIADSVSPRPRFVIAYFERPLSDVQKILVSPDYAPNFRGAEIAGLVEGDLETQYRAALEEITKGSPEAVVFIGDRALPAQFVVPKLLAGLQKIAYSAAFLSDLDSALCANVKNVFGSRTILEKSGLLINRSSRIQFFEAVVPALEQSENESSYLLDLGALLKVPELPGASGSVDLRTLTQWVLKTDARLKDITIRKLKQEGGVGISC